MGKKFQSQKAKFSTTKVVALFCNETSLHGWSYLGLGPDKMSKIWKMILVTFLSVVIVTSVVLVWTKTNQVSFSSFKIHL
jgi:hypothetical protein